MTLRPGPFLHAALAGLVCVASGPGSAQAPATRLVFDCTSTITTRSIGNDGRTSVERRSASAVLSVDLEANLVLIGRRQHPASITDTAITYEIEHKTTIMDSESKQGQFTVLERGQGTIQRATGVYVVKTSATVTGPDLRSKEDSEGRGICKASTTP